MCIIAADGGGLWSFNDDFPRNVIIFEVNNNSSCHTDKKNFKNLKNYFLILDEENTFGINRSFGASDKNRY